MAITVLVEGQAMLSQQHIRRVVSTLTVVAAPTLASCGTDHVAAPDQVSTLTLARVGAVALPARVDSFTVDSGPADLAYESFAEGGELTLTGNPATRYSVSVRLATYAVSTVNGQRTFRLAGTSRETDRGTVSQDASGQLVFTSTYVSPLSHTATATPTGMQLAFRIPGDDTVLDLFYRREPN